MNEKTPMPRQMFARHVVGMSLLRVLIGFAIIGSSLIVARWLGPAGLGILTTIQVAVLTTVQLGSLGLPAAGTYFVAQDHRTLPPLAINALLYSLLAGSILSLALIGLTTSGTRLFVDIPQSVMVLAAIAVPFQLIVLFGGSIFLGVGKILRFNFLDVAGQTSLLLSAIVTLVILGTGLYGLVTFNTFVYLALALVVIAMIYSLVINVHGRATGPDLKLFANMARYGIKFHVATVAGILVFRVDLLFVKYFRGAEEAGIYAVAAQAGMVMMMLPNIIGTLLFPTVAASRDISGRLTARVTRHTALILLLGCLLAAPMSFAIPFVFGPAFNEATFLFLLLLPGIFLIGIESVLVQHFSGTGLPVAIPLFWLATLLVNLGLNLVLVPGFGARGAAVSSAISYALIFVLVAFYFRHKTSTRISDVLFARRDEIRDLISDLPAGLMARRSSG